MPQGHYRVTTQDRCHCHASERSGCGSELAPFADARSAPDAGVFVVLEGDPAMYARFGFRPASEFGLERPSELIPEPAFQAVALPAHRPGLTGRVEYPQYFFDIGAVVYFLRKVVWTVPGFDPERHRDRLRSLHERIERDGVFRSTMSRTLFEVRKPEDA